MYCECGYTAGTEKNKMPVVLFLTTVYIPLWHRAVVCAVFYSIDIRTAGADIIQFLSHNTPHLLFPHLQILRKQTKTSVHDVQNVQNNLAGTGVRRAPGRLHFPEWPVMKNRKFSLCCKMYPLILRFRFLCVFNSLYLLSF